MGRRALRGIDASLDLSRHLKLLSDLPVPWNATLLFDRQAPLEVEVGSGKGLFLRTAAQMRPDTNFLGLEVSHKYARFAAASLATRNIANAMVVDCDGLRVFRELLPDNQLAAVHVYFPDPWWKARHKKRRVMTSGFAAHIERTLQPGGTLHFWTDVQEYFQETLDLLVRETALAGPIDVPETPAEHDFDYRTHFERRMRLNNEPVYRSEFRKR